MKSLIKSIASIIIFQLSLNTTNAQCTGEWTKQGGGQNDLDRALTTATDNSGNVYVAGEYSSTVTFSANTLISSSAEDIFLAKYDLSGNLLWIKSFGGYNTNSPSSLAFDSNNNIYMTGTNFGTALIDTITLTNVTGSPDAFVAKFDSLGNVQWAKAIGNTDWDQGGGIAVHNNELYINGAFSLSVVMGSTTLTSLGNRDFYLAKMDLNGNYIWARSAGSTHDDMGRYLAVDASGNIFVNGMFSADLTIGSNTLINTSGSFYGFIAKYDTNGNESWAKSVTSTGEVIMGTLAINNNNDIYVSLGGGPVCVFGSTTITTYGDKDIMLAKYNNNGNVIWVKKAGGADRDIASAVAVSGNNKIYLSGSFAGNATFGTIGLTLPGVDYIFVAEYDSSGNANFVKHAGGLHYDYASTVACSNNNVFVCGNFSGTTSFDSNTLTADTNGGNAFIWKACNGVVGIDEVSSTFKSSVYPNPFTDKLNIDVGNYQSMEIILWDITSRNIFQQKFSNFTTINTEQLMKGIYFYELRSSDGSSVKGKVVKD